MREMIAIAAEAERVEESGLARRRGRFSHETMADLPAHTFPGRSGDSEFTTEGTEGRGGSESATRWTCARAGCPRDSRQDAGATEEGQNPEISGVEQIENSKSVDTSIPELTWEEERERRIYRARTVTMLRRYMRYSIETGRLPSLLGREFFRAKVTAYTVVTFEDRVILVHDMETCLNRLDEFSRQIIARHILQEHDQEATARLLHCTDRTVRTYVPIVLDLLSEILLDVGLLERIVPIRGKSCQGGETGKIFVSDCEERKNKFRKISG